MWLTPFIDYSSSTLRPFKGIGSNASERVTSNTQTSQYRTAVDKSAPRAELGIVGRSLVAEVVQPTLEKVQQAQLAPLMNF
jgi:hypothetical protein